MNQKGNEMSEKSENKTLPSLRRGMTIDGAKVYGLGVGK